MATTKKKTKAVPKLTEEEQKLLDQLRTKRDQVAKLRKEMDALEEKIRPLAAKRVAVGKLKAAGLSEDEVAALKGK